MRVLVSSAHGAPGTYDRVLTPADPPVPADRVVLDDVLGLTPPAGAFALARGWADALRPGGELVVRETDVLAVADAVAAGEVETAVAVAQLFGPEATRRWAYHLAEAVELIDRLGLSLTARELSGPRFVVKGIKA